MLGQLTTLLLVMVLVLTGTVVALQVDPRLFQQKHIDPLGWQPPDISKQRPEGRHRREIQYGYTLITETSRLIGPMAKNPAMHSMQGTTSIARVATSTAAAGQVLPPGLGWSIASRSSVPGKTKRAVSGTVSMAAWSAA